MRPIPLLLALVMWLVCPAISWASNDVTFADDFEASRLHPGWNRFSLMPPPGFNPAALDEARLVDVVLQRSRNLQVVSSPVRHGKAALKITVYPDDTPASGDAERGKSRAEIGVKEVSREGVEGWYAWSVFIPPDYADAPPGRKPFQVLTQFHRYTRKLNKRYVDFSQLSKHQRARSEGVSPAVSIVYARADGVHSTLTLRYGLENRKQEWTLPIEKGRWYDWLLHIWWSRQADGFIEARVNGQPLTPFNGTDYKAFGPNLYTELPVDVRWGIYRGHHRYTTINSIVIDDVRLGPSRASVDVRGSR